MLIRCTTDSWERYSTVFVISIKHYSQIATTCQETVIKWIILMEVIRQTLRWTLHFVGLFSKPRRIWVLCSITIKSNFSSQTRHSSSMSFKSSGDLSSSIVSDHVLIHVHQYTRLSCTLIEFWILVQGSFLQNSLPHFLEVTSAICHVHIELTKLFICHIIIVCESHFDRAFHVIPFLHGLVKCMHLVTIQAHLLQLSKSNVLINFILRVNTSKLN